MDLHTILLQPWVLICSVVVGITSFYVWYKTNYFKRHGIPHTPSVPIVGHMLPVMSKRKHFFIAIQDLYNFWSEAKYFGFYDCMTPIIVLRDLELIKAVTVKNFEHFVDRRDFFNEDIDPFMGKSLIGLKGAKWRELRALLTPAFTGAKMKMMFGLMSRSCEDFVAHLPKDTIVEYEIKDVFNKYTNDVIATCAFGLEVNSLKDPENDFYKFAKKIINFGDESLFTFLIVKSCPMLAKLLDLHVLDQKMTSYFKNLIDQTMKTRVTEGIVRPDILQLIMEAKNETSGEQELDLDDMCALAFGFFFGGFDATSSLMSFAAASIALNEEVQEKLYSEISEVLESSNGNLNYDTLAFKTPYLDAVLYETLRLYSVAGILDRVCTKDFELPPALPGLRPFLVKRGMNVWIPASGIHHDASYYPNPDVFDPERFLNQKMNFNQPGFLGFGIGPRSCIGLRFGLLETKLVIFNLLAKYRLEPSEKLKVPLTLALVPFTLLVEGGFWLRLVPRNANSAFETRSSD